MQNKKGSGKTEAKQAAPTNCDNQQRRTYDSDFKLLYFVTTASFLPSWLRKQRCQLEDSIAPRFVAPLAVSWRRLT